MTHTHTHTDRDLLDLLDRKTIREDLLNHFTYDGHCQQSVVVQSSRIQITALAAFLWGYPTFLTCCNMLQAQGRLIPSCCFVALASVSRDRWHSGSSPVPHDLPEIQWSSSGGNFCLSRAVGKHLRLLELPS